MILIFYTYLSVTRTVLLASAIESICTRKSCFTALKRVVEIFDFKLVHQRLNMHSTSHYYATTFWLGVIYCSWYSQTFWNLLVQRCQHLTRRKASCYYLLDRISCVYVQAPHTRMFSKVGRGAVVVLIILLHFEIPSNVPQNSNCFPLTVGQTCPDFTLRLV